jgi:hypothetical protein
MILAYFIGKKKWQIDARGRQLFADHLRKDSRVGGDALLSDKSARTMPARLDRVRRVARRRLRGLHQRRLLILRHVFLKCAASRGARKSALTEVVPALRRPRWSAPVRRRAPPKRLRDVDCALRTPPRQDCNTRSPAQNLQHQTLRGRPQSTGEGATHARIEAGGLNVPRQPQHAECCAINAVPS